MARWGAPAAGAFPGHTLCCEHAESPDYKRAVELLRVRGVPVPEGACCALRPCEMVLRSLDGEQDMGKVRCWAGNAGEPLFLLVASKALNATANTAAFEVQLPDGRPLSLPGLSNYGVASYCAALGQLCALAAASPCTLVTATTVQKQQHTRQHTPSPASDWLDVLLDAADLIEGREVGNTSAWCGVGPSASTAVGWYTDAGSSAHRRHGRHSAAEGEEEEVDPLVDIRDNSNEQEGQRARQRQLEQQLQEQRERPTPVPVQVTAFVGYAPPSEPALAAGNRRAATGMLGGTFSPLLLPVSGSGVAGMAAAAAAPVAPSGPSRGGQRPACALSAPAVGYAAGGIFAAVTAFSPALGRAGAPGGVGVDAPLVGLGEVDTPPLGNDDVALLPLDDMCISPPPPPVQPNAAGSAGQLRLTPTTPQPRWPPQHFHYSANGPCQQMPFPYETCQHPHQQRQQQNQQPHSGWSYYQPCLKPQSCHAGVALAAQPVPPPDGLPRPRVGLAAAAAAAGRTPLPAAAGVEVTCVGSVEATCVGDLLRVAGSTADGAVADVASDAGTPQPPQPVPLLSVSAPFWFPAACPGSFAADMGGSRSHHGVMAPTAGPWQCSASGGVPAPAVGSGAPYILVPLHALLPHGSQPTWRHAHPADADAARNHLLHCTRSDSVVMAPGGGTQPSRSAGQGSPGVCTSAGVTNANTATATVTATAAAAEASPQLLLPVPVCVGVSDSGDAGAAHSEDGTGGGDAWQDVAGECVGACDATEPWETDSLGGWDEYCLGCNGTGCAACGGGCYMQPGDGPDCDTLLAAMGVLSIGVGARAAAAESGGGGFPWAGIPVTGHGAGGAATDTNGDCRVPAAHAAAAAPAVTAAATSRDAKSFQDIFEECLDDYDVYQVLCRIGNGGGSCAVGPGAAAADGGVPAAAASCHAGRGVGCGLVPSEGAFGSSASLLGSAMLGSTMDFVASGGAGCGAAEAMGVPGPQLAGWSRA